MTRLSTKELVCADPTDELRTAAIAAQGKPREAYTFTPLVEGLNALVAQVRAQHEQAFGMVLAAYEDDQVMTMAELLQVLPFFLETHYAIEDLRCAMEVAQAGGMAKALAKVEQMAHERNEVRKQAAVR